MGGGGAVATTKHSAVPHPMGGGGAVATTKHSAIPHPMGGGGAVATKNIVDVLSGAVLDADLNAFMAA